LVARFLSKAQTGYALPREADYSSPDAKLAFRRGLRWGFNPLPLDLTAGPRLGRDGLTAPLSKPEFLRHCRSFAAELGAAMGRSMAGLISRGIAPVMPSNAKCRRID